VKSVIEGWALVDNTQNEDWRGVELSLVSGASNSFIYDLYNPRYAARTEARPSPPHLHARPAVTCVWRSLTPDHHAQIEVEQEETLAPPTLEDAVAQHDVSALVEATNFHEKSTLSFFVDAGPHVLNCQPCHDFFRGGHADHSRQGRHGAAPAHGYATPLSPLNQALW
jgi:hypothetical protein